MGSARGETSAPRFKPKVKSQPRPGERNAPKQLHINKPKKLARKTCSHFLQDHTHYTNKCRGVCFFLKENIRHSAGNIFSLSCLSLSQSIGQSTDIFKAINHIQRHLEALCTLLMPPEQQESKEQQTAQSTELPSLPRAGAELNQQLSSSGKNAASKRRKSFCFFCVM